MIRSKGKPTRRRKKKIFKMASGYFGSRKNCFRISRRAVWKAMEHRKKSYKMHLRDLQKGRILIIKSALEEFSLDYKYNKFMNKNLQTLKLSKQVLSDIVKKDPEFFIDLVKYIMDLEGAKNV